MKQFEKLAIEYASQFKQWDFQCVAKDAYLTAFKHALEMAKTFTLSEGEFMDIELKNSEGVVIQQQSVQNTPLIRIANKIVNVGNEEIEVMLPSGGHQLVDDIK